LGELVVPRDQRLTVENCAALAERLRDVREKFRRWGLRLVDSPGRLYDAQQVLDGIASTGRYPDASNAHALRCVAHALRDAVQFDQIGRALPDDLQRQFTSELSRSLSGTLPGRERSRSPYQLQSQYWVTAMLALGGMHIHVPPPGWCGSLPDVLFRIGERRYGIEVKRPTSRSGILAALKDGRSQLEAAAVRGGVLVDATDVIGDELLTGIVGTAVEEPYDPAMPIIRDISARARRLVYDAATGRVRPAFWPCALVMVFALGWRWTPGDMTAPELFVPFGIFATHSGRVLDSDTQDALSIYVALNKGMEATRVRRLHDRHPAPFPDFFQ
jgi:hypothetical protein